MVSIVLICLSQLAVPEPAEETVHDTAAPSERANTVGINLNPFMGNSSFWWEHRFNGGWAIRGGPLFSYSQTQRADFSFRSWMLGAEVGVSRYLDSEARGGTWLGIRLAGSTGNSVPSFNGPVLAPLDSSSMTRAAVRALLGHSFVWNNRLTVQVAAGPELSHSWSDSRLDTTEAAGLTGEIGVGLAF